MSDPISPAPTASLAFRPASYRDDVDPLAAVLRNVKGTNRRKMITDHWNAGKIEELDPDLLADETDPGLRRFLESIHPSLMGGEYLPDFLPTEVEIARVELQSTTSDVISIRARKRPGDDRIHYRVIDEYDTEFEIEPESSQLPLTLGELIAFIDAVGYGDAADDGGLALCHNNANLDPEICPAESLRHFTTVSSTVYPGLFEHYDAIHERWCQEVLAELEEEEEK